MKLRNKRSKKKQKPSPAKQETAAPLPIAQANHHTKELVEAMGVTKSIEYSLFYWESYIDHGNYVEYLNCTLTAKIGKWKVGKKLPSIIINWSQSIMEIGAHVFSLTVETRAWGKRRVKTVE